jgi:hypothetical protein
MKILRDIRILLLSIIVFGGENCFSAVDYLQGNIINMTSGPSGLMLKLDSGVPTNCAGTPYGWMLIRAENKIMAAVVLTMYASGKRGATVYTTAVAAGGFCEINQFDPIE